MPIQLLNDIKYMPGDFDLLLGVPQANKQREINMVDYLLQFLHSTLRPSARGAVPVHGTETTEARLGLLSRQTWSKLTECCWFQLGTRAGALTPSYKKGSLWKVTAYAQYLTVQERKALRRNLVISRSGHWFIPSDNPPLTSGQHLMFKRQKKTTFRSTFSRITLQRRKKKCPHDLQKQSAYALQHKLWLLFSYHA